MRKSFFAGAVAVMACLALFGCDRFKTQPVKWQYYVTWGNPYDAHTRDYLGQCGKEGWELVSVAGPAAGETQAFFYFKRSYR